ncbi:MAG: flagellar filament capping protein FliD [Muribaculum sp.]|nr:flagellar filament capping protein FliD [Muribaculum sp.]
MAMRLSGLMSGMDTESLIQQLVEAKSTKLNKTKKAQIKYNWKQDAWKELNTKLKNLQTKYLSNMRFSEAYSKKVTKVSNDSIASVITGDKAVNGVQNLQVKQLAKTGYLTGAELRKTSNGQSVKGDYTAQTKLSELDSSLVGEGTFSVKTASGSVDVKVNGDTTISDVLNKFKEVGLNATFDTGTQRFFISSKESGVSNDFSITASDATGASALSALGLQVKLGDDKASLAQYQEYAGYYVAGDRDQTLLNMKSLIDDTVASRTDAYLNQYKSYQSSLKAAQDKKQEIIDKYKDDPNPLSTAADYEERLKNLEESKKNELLTEGDKKFIDEQIAALTERKNDAETLETQNKTIDTLNDKINDVKEYIDVTPQTGDDETTYSAVATGKLTGEVENSFYAKAEYADKVINAPATAAEGDDDNVATKISGQDAIIMLNGAKFTNNTNVFDINGLTITALSDAKPDETVTLSTQNDTDGIYDMIKNFLKEYNAVINEMDKLYNASSAKGYEPLLSDEKEAMSDSEVEEYEKKIKESLLRNDSNLSSISTALKTIMINGVEVNGKKMYLSDFGINTLGYFTAADNEKNAYHIDGDEDDANTSGNADVLKGLISSDPDTVISFFKGLSASLYDKMSDMSKSVQNYRSFGNFYDDKKMKSDYDNYTSKIKDLEDKLNAYEDKWYSKFSKMETAMAKMQRNANAISGLLGGS